MDCFLVDLIKLQDCFARKVSSSKLSLLVAHSKIFRLFTKGKFDAYAL